MPAPVRVQLSRAKGWRLPPNTLVVSRPTRHGNPFRVVPWGKSWGVLRAFRLGSTDATLMGFGAGDLFPTAAEARQRAVDLYREAVEAGQVPIDCEALRGKNLACWCPLDQPCHADVQLFRSNTPVSA
jgi:hypothetical protein